MSTGKTRNPAPAPQLSLDDEMRKLRTPRQMQEEALRLADRFLAGERWRVYNDAGDLRDRIHYGLHAAVTEDLGRLVFSTLNFLEKFEPIIYSGATREPDYIQAVNDLNAAHLAANGRPRLALWVLGLLEQDEPPED